MKKIFESLYTNSIACYFYELVRVVSRSGRALPAPREYPVIPGWNTSSKRSKRSERSGQALTEYIVVFIILIGVFVMVATFLSVFKEHGGRVLDLVASEFP